MNHFKILITILIGLLIILNQNIGNLKNISQITKLNNHIKILKFQIQEKDSIIILINEKNNNLKQFVKCVFSQPLPKYRSMNLTGYHPVKEQCDNTPDITADGTKIDINYAGDYRYVALSRDLLTHWGGLIKFGDFVLIKGTPDEKQDGIYQVRDTMNPRHSRWIDILLTPGDESFYYRTISMYRIIQNDHVQVLQEIYGQSSIKPLAKLTPEI